MDDSAFTNSLHDKNSLHNRDLSDEGRFNDSSDDTSSKISLDDTPSESLLHDIPLNSSFDARSSIDSSGDRPSKNSIDDTPSRCSLDDITSKSSLDDKTINSSSDKEISKISEDDKSFKVSMHGTQSNSSSDVKSSRSVNSLGDSPLKGLLGGTLTACSLNDGTYKNSSDQVPSKSPLDDRSPKNSFDYKSPKRPEETMKIREEVGHLQMTGKQEYLKIHYQRGDFSPSVRTNHLNQREYNLSVNFKVSIYKGDILKSNVDAISCGQDPAFMSFGNISRRILKQFPNVAEQIRALKREKTYETGNVCNIKFRINDARNIIVVITNSSEDAKESLDTLENIKMYFSKVLQFADRNKIRSLALPFLLSGTVIFFLFFKQ